MNPFSMNVSYGPQVDVERLFDRWEARISCMHGLQRSLRHPLWHDHPELTVITWILRELDNIRLGIEAEGRQPCDCFTADKIEHLQRDLRPYRWLEEALNNL